MNFRAGLLCVSLRAIALMGLMKWLYRKFHCNDHLKTPESYRVQGGIVYERKINKQRKMKKARNRLYNDQKLKRIWNLFEIIFVVFTFNSVSLFISENIFQCLFMWAWSDVNGLSDCLFKAKFRAQEILRIFGWG